MERIKELESFIAELTAKNSTDLDLFRGLIGRSQELLALSDSDLSREFTVSRPTISRWKNGVSAPQPLMRKMVLDRLAKKTKGHLRYLSGSSGSGNQGSGATGDRKSVG